MISVTSYRLVATEISAGSWHDPQVWHDEDGSVQLRCMHPSSLHPGLVTVPGNNLCGERPPVSPTPTVHTQSMALDSQMSATVRSPLSTSLIDLSTQCSASPHTCPQKEVAIRYSEQSNCMTRKLHTCVNLEHCKRFQHPLAASPWPSRLGTAQIG